MSKSKWVSGETSHNKHMNKSVSQLTSSRTVVNFDQDKQTGTGTRAILRQLACSNCALSLSLFSLFYLPSGTVILLLLLLDNAQQTDWLTVCVDRSDKESWHRHRRVDYVVSLLLSSSSSTTSSWRSLLCLVAVLVVNRLLILEF